MQADAELIERLRADDIDALDVLFRRYYPQVYRTALAITHDSAAAEDIAQDCFLRLNQYAARIDTSLPLAPWLYRVTVNLTYSWLTRRSRRRVSLDGLIDQLMMPQRHAPDKVAEDDELTAQVQRAVAALPFNQRVVVALHYLNGLSLDEIAGVVNCPLGTVKSRLYYARETLRQTLGGATRNPGDEIAHGYAGLEGAV